MSSGISLVRGPHRASLCTVFITKFVLLADGTEKEAGYATGFMYRRAGTSYLVTCWHVLTGRRPDDPGMVVSAENAESPSRIKVVYPLKQVGHFSVPLVIDLYEKGKPIWLERDREKGVDLAVIPLDLPDYVASVSVQDAAQTASEESWVEIGLDVVITGYPLGHGPHSPFPIWKKAMIASEPRYLTSDHPFFLIDTPGVPGMSGSPIYRISRGFVLPRPLEGNTASEKIMSVDLDHAVHDATILSFVGVYLGSTGAKAAKELDRLNLGRAHLAGFLNALIDDPEAGFNPFPPTAAGNMTDVVP